MNFSRNTYAADAGVGLEARFGLRVASLLNQRAEAAEHDVSERLRVAREQALERARASRRATAAVSATGVSAVGMTGHGTALLGQHTPWWTRVASVLPLVALVMGLVLIDRWHDRAQITAAADVDSALLVDDLPPDAYRDPGFVEFLKASRE